MPLLGVLEVLRDEREREEDGPGPVERPVLPGAFLHRLDRGSEVPGLIPNGARAMASILAPSSLGRRDPSVAPPQASRDASSRR
eukprot:187359-Pyramimonas_sp.AAC.1